MAPQSPALGNEATPLALPGPALRGHVHQGDPARANEECASCHGAIAEEWKASLHKQAWNDPVFQKAYALEPVAFCRGCHAPEADPVSEPRAEAKAVGVGCTTCHVEGARIVGARASPGAPHGVYADARMATREACGSCHQFDFPGEKTPMQNTLREHAGSSLASVECQACHMPNVAGASAGERPHRSHAFTVIGNPALIRRAASVTAARAGSRGITVTVAPASAGHAFPTGDMFRRLEIRGEALDAQGRIVAIAEPVYLGRTFADRPRDRQVSFAFHRVQADDSRVQAPGGQPRVVELHFPKPVSEGRVRWRVAYQRMGTAMAASFRVDQAVDEIIVAEGEIPAKGGVR
jgi:hypothetical protein